MPQLSSAFVKLGWANKQLNHLVKAFERFKEFHAPLKVSLRTETDGTQDFFISEFGRVKKPGRGWSLLVGDIVMGYRAALDHSVWRLTDQSIRQDPERSIRVGFPIFDDLERYRKRRYVFIGSLPGAAKTIIDDAQPCKGAYRPFFHPLWRLAYLSNMDKHRAIHLLVTAPNGVRVSYGDQVRWFYPEAVERGAEIARLSSVDIRRFGTNVHANHEVGLSIAFDEGPLIGVGVIGTLNRIRDEVAKIVRLLAQFPAAP